MIAELIRQKFGQFSFTPFRAFWSFGAESDKWDSFPRAPQLVLTFQVKIGNFSLGFRSVPAQTPKEASKNTGRYIHVLTADEFHREWEPVSTARTSPPTFFNLIRHKHCSSLKRCRKHLTMKGKYQNLTSDGDPKKKKKQSA
ncbi:hypothetical protein ABW19_dt0201661 [Dactylella cylindrospora]|nr:hypothetical protein ABW19_dt0201661 [Dactylella cylindrospora]